jgi:hypothetical protein
MLSPVQGGGRWIFVLQKREIHGSKSLKISSISEESSEKTFQFNLFSNVKIKERKREKQTNECRRK